MEDKKFSEIPPFGWTVSFNHSFSEPRQQIIKPTWSQIRSLILLGIRYFFYYLYLWFKHRIPVMDFLYTMKNDTFRGVPFGGIGCGSVGRSFRGEFCNYQMIPGMYKKSKPIANQFIVAIHDEELKILYQKVLCVCDKPSEILSSWDWEYPASEGKYCGLYPRAWYEFDINELNVKLICRQVSPIIPDNYKDSSIPGGVFVWTIINNSSKNLNISVTLTTKNGIGNKDDNYCLARSNFFSKRDDLLEISGVILNDTMVGLPYSYSIAVSHSVGNVVSKCAFFNPSGDGKDIWVPLRINGELKCGPSSHEVVSQELGIAVCSKTLVSSMSSNVLEFSLVWDMPLVSFPAHTTLRKRYYTKFFGDDGSAGPDLAFHCLKNYKNWENAINQWQSSVINDSSLPAWYKSALFNELYYISDGGTIWLLPFDSEKFSPSDPRYTYGHFAYLEGHEYRMYNTYDVHFYASFALATLWPKLQHCIQYDIRDSIDFEDSNNFWYLYNGKVGPRKVKGTVPHDLGDPDEEPFILINSYPIHDVSQWKDLNLKFVLQVYRDYCLSNDKQYVEDMFPQVLTVMEKSLLWDKDDDGMIENSGEPDQTYDCWVMTGVSAYCGSLWLASLHSTIKLATVLHNTSVISKFTKILDKAKNSFNEKLWNGNYYNFDCSETPNSKSIMSDQLCGIWYLRCSNDFEELLPKQNVTKAINTIYEYNVLKYFDGKQGAVNGMLPSGDIDSFSVQSEEMWTGVAYSVSALLLSEGLLKEGFNTAEGLYNTVYNKSGLSFATPEALQGTNSFRSLSYMRPLSIWSIQAVLQNTIKKLPN